MKLIQKLFKRKDKRVFEMHYNFPNAKFVEKATWDEQIEKIKEEAKEVTNAPHFFVQVHEVFDLYHACETAIRMFEKACGREWVEKIYRATIEKNKERGYYDGVGEN